MEGDAGRKNSKLASMTAYATKIVTKKSEDMPKCPYEDLKHRSPRHVD